MNSFSCMQVSKKNFQGSSKFVYTGTEQGTLVFSFKDETSSGEIIPGRGAINNRISEMFMKRLKTIGVPNHFIRCLNMREQLVRFAEPFPFRVYVHNVAQGDFAKRMGLEEKVVLGESIIEFELKPAYTGAPFISENHIRAFEWATLDELDQIFSLTRRINDFLRGQFLAIDFSLISYPLEFGQVYLSDFNEETQVFLIDEISVDTCLLMCQKTGTFTVSSQEEEFTSETSALCGINEKVYQEIALRFGLLKN